MYKSINHLNIKVKNMSHNKDYVVYFPFATFDNFVQTIAELRDPLFNQDVYRYQNTIFNEPEYSCGTHIDEIHVMTQFFIHSNPQRHNEIHNCIQRNVTNQYITKIHLLNERMYNNIELGVSNTDKITQVDINARVSYRHFFDYIIKSQIKGYIVICNADIYFDDTPDEQPVACDLSCASYTWI